MRIVFMGTPEFAVPCLKSCHAHHEVVGVFTQPDRPKGRGHKLAPPPVKEVALELGLNVYQPERIKNNPEAFENLKALNPDCIVVVAYGQILPKALLELPSKGCVNVHGSLLPKYRGASPIQWSIVQGETLTGNTTMYMNEGLDTGDMIFKNEVVITESMNAGELHDQLMASGAELLEKTLAAIERDVAPRVAQEEQLTCYAPLLDKKMAEINWELETAQIHNHIRGLNPWPIAHTTLTAQPVKVFKGQAADEALKPSQTSLASGTILFADKNGILVKTGTGAYLIKEIQMPNSKRMDVASYLLGHSLDAGLVLGQ